MAWKPKSGRAVTAAWKPKSGTPVAPADVEPDQEEVPAEPTGPGKAESLMLGMGQGATLSFGDELQGGLDAARELVGRVPGLEGVRPTQTPMQRELDAEVGKVPVGRALLEAYRNGRDRSRQYDEEARKENPKTFLAGELAGAVAVPMPPVAAAGKGAAAVAARVGKAAAAGGVAGLGSSDADLTKGEVGQAAKDTVVSAALGAGGGLLAEGAGALKGVFRGKKEKAIADALAKRTAQEEKKVASALGKYRSGVQSASRDLEVLGRESEAMAPGQLKEQIQDFLKSSTAQQLREQVAGNKLGTAPERLSEMQQLLEEYKALAAGKDAAIAEATNKDLAGSTAARKAGKFVYNYAARMGPALLGFGVGASHGGVSGALGGTALGGMLGMMAGHPGTALKNLSKDPAMRRVVFTALEHTLGSAPEALGKYTGLLTVAAKRGRDELLRTHETLLQEDPDYVSTLLGAGQGDDDKPKVSPADYGSHGP